MKKILGLDLGVNSIGWAIVLEGESPEEESSVVDMGVRIVPLDTDEKTNFEKGKAITTNVDRRVKRGMRRNLQRYKLRRENLKSILISNGIIKSDSILSENGSASTYQTYRLRAMAATEKIPLEDLARVLLMINKKRGYKSSRRSKGEDDGTAINSMDLAIKMYEENLTPGQICLDILTKGKTKLPDFYQSDLLSEFREIWHKQQEYYPEMLTDELLEQVIGKTSKQTFAILSKELKWRSTEKIWDDENAATSTVEKEYTIKGIKRSKKGVAQKIENYQWRTAALNDRIGPEQLVVVLQDINSQINSSSGYLGRISDRSKTLYLEHKTVGQYLWEQIMTDNHKSLKNMVFYRQDYLDEFNTIWETQSKYYDVLTPELKSEIRDVIIFYQRRLKSQKGLISLCELEQREITINKNGKDVTKVIGRRVIPKSHPLYQEFRIWQTLNNVEVSLGAKKKRLNQSPTIFDEIMDPLELHGHRPLYPEEMDKLARELSVKEYLTKTEVIKLLFDGRKDLDINYDKIIGNQTIHALYKTYSNIIENYGYSAIDFRLPTSAIQRQLTNIFEKLGWNTQILTPCICDDIKMMEALPTYQLWHLLYSYEGDNSNSGDKKLIEHLSSRYGFSNDDAALLATVSFEPEYGSLCAKAISKILPYLKEGNTYDLACAYAGYNHSRQSITAQENAQRILKPYIESLAKNSLRNPVVEKILNQMVNVVNALIDAYGNKGADGPFDEIRVELARELKKNAKEREELSKAIRDNDDENKRIREVLKKEFGLQHVSRNDIIRYKLYCELKGNEYKTLYSNTYIPREKLFSKEIEIEHIIPQACLFDDSLSNKTLEYHSVNIAKGKKTAYDYVREVYGEAGAEDYESRCRKCFPDKRAKLNKLLMTSKDIPEDFIERDLRNTQYISKKALSMLRTICRCVFATTGTITDRLRVDWQLVDVLKEINLPKYQRLDLVNTYRSDDGHEIRTITDWTKRNDHRHHAMDALTVAFTRSVFIQYYNNINASSDPDAKDGQKIMGIKIKYFKGGIAMPPMPLKALRAEAKKFLEKILVSLKAKNKVVTVSTNKIMTKKGVIIDKTNTPRGALHKETSYGLRKKYVTKTEKVGSSFDEQKIATVSCAKYRNALMNRLMEYGGDPKKAFTGRNSLENNPIYIDEAKTQTVPAQVKTVTIEEYYTVRQAVGPNLSLNSVNNVVDNAVRDALKQRLALYDNDPTKAFANLENDPILLHGHPLKRVTVGCNDKLNPVRDKRDKEGNEILDAEGCPIPTDYFAASENHHAAIFRRPKLDKNGNIIYDEYGRLVYEWEQKIISFFEAVTRVNNGMPVVDKSWGNDEGWQFVFSIKKNEYFVFPDPASNFFPEEVDLSDPENYAEISKHLFRSQKMSSNDYFFRHHLETTVTDDKRTKNTTWIRVLSLKQLNGIVKVRIDHIGRIVAVGEY